MNDLTAFVLLILSLLGLMFSGLLVANLVAASRTSTWSATHGRILASDLQTKQTSDLTHDGEPVVRTYPAVVYEYEVEGRKHRAQRVKLGDRETPDEAPEETVAGYPVGATVPVYYDPVRPGEAVLMRDSPRLWAERLACLIVIWAVLALGAIFGLGPVEALVNRLFPRSQSPELVILSSGLGLLVMLFGVFWRRQALAEKRWPVITGEVVSSKVESYSGRLGPTAHSTQATLYRPIVIYRYEVDGRHFESNQVSRERFRTQAPQAAEAVAKRYPIGPVKVRYNPANHADAVLETNALGFVLLWLVAALLFAVAASLTGMACTARQ